MLQNKEVVVVGSEYQETVGGIDNGYYRHGTSSPCKVSIQQRKVYFKPEVFALRDITGDGNPEFFVGKKYDQFTVYQGDCSCFVVYTWKNGKVMPIFGNSFMDNLNPGLYIVNGDTLVTWGHGTGGYLNWEYVWFENGLPMIKNYEQTWKLGGKRMNMPFSRMQSQFQKRSLIVMF